MQRPGSVSQIDRAPVLVLGLGNLLLGDDAIGLELLRRMRDEAGQWGNTVEFVDGGTQGLMLLGEISERRAVLVLDAVDQGEKPGSIAVLREKEVAAVGAHRSTTAHEGNAGELLAAARILGESPGEIAVVGVQPERVATGIGLSETVQSSIRPALLEAKQVVDDMVGRYA